MCTKIKWPLKLMIPVIFLLTTQKSTAQQAPLTLKTAIDMAIANNNSLKADSLNLLMPDYQEKILKADFLPHVNYYTKTEYNPAIASQMLPGAVAGQPSKEFVPVQFGARYNMGMGVEVSQTLVRRSTRIQLGATALNKSIALTKHNLTKEELVYQVAIAYYGLQANAEMIRTTTRDYENIKEVVSIAKAQFENGTLKRIDYESLEINAANKQSYLSQLQTQYNEQLAMFNYLLGLPADSRTVIGSNLGGNAKMIEQGNQFGQRGDIQLYSQLIESKEVEIKSIRAEALPVVNSYFRYNYQSQFNQPSKAFNYDFKSSTIGVSATISLFDGYRRRNRTRVAQAELQQLKFRQDHQQQLSNTQWVTANETLTNDRQQYLVTQKNLELAEKVFTSRKALYTEGVTTLIELLDAERELSQSRNLHIQSIINVHTSTVDLYKAKGTLLTEFLQSL
jgi:outer membrane protein